jgi:hypothetical protein
MYKGGIKSRGGNNLHTIKFLISANKGQSNRILFLKNPNDAVYIWINIISFLRPILINDDVEFLNWLVKIIVTLRNHYSLCQFFVVGVVVVFIHSYKSIKRLNWQPVIGHFTCTSVCTRGSFGITQELKFKV